MKRLKSNSLKPTKEHSSDYRTVAAVFLLTGYPIVLRIPLFICRISAGFPSPAEEWLEERIDLNRWLIEHPATTFLVRVEGDSMTGAKIHDGDVLIVDRMITATDGDIIIARVNSDMTVKTLCIIEDEVWLKPENEAYPSIRITEDMSFEVWGIVRHSIHTISKRQKAKLYTVR